MKRIKHIFLGVMSILLLLIACVIFLLCTTKGIQMAINGASRWVPGLDIASVNGGWRGLSLKGIKYKTPGLIVNIREFYLSVDISCFKYRSLCINALSTQDVNITLNTKETGLSELYKKISDYSSHFSMPYPIILRLLTLYNVTINLDDMFISLPELRSGWKWQAHELILMPTNINSLFIALPKISKKIQIKSIQPIITVIKNVTSNINKINKFAPQLREPSLGEILKKLFSTPILPDVLKIHLPFDIIVDEINAKQLRLVSDNNFFINNLLIKGSVKDQRIKLDNFNILSPKGYLSAQGEVTFVKNCSINLVINNVLNIQPIKEEKITLTIRGELREVLKVMLNLSGVINAQFNIQTRLSEVGLPFILKVHSRQLKWPLNGKSQYRVKDFDLYVKGKATDYVISMHANVIFFDRPLIEFILDGKGKGNLKQFKLEPLRLVTLYGQTYVTALIDWSNVITWNAQLTLSVIKNTQQWPEWPTTLEAKITTHGVLHGSTWQIQVPMLQVDGNIKNHKIKVRGMLSGNNTGQWKIPSIVLSVGSNTVKILGQFDQNIWDLDSHINAPNLDRLVSGLGGIIKGNLKLRGTSKVPQLLVDLTAVKIKWKQVSINRIKINGDMCSIKHMHGQLRVRLEQLKHNTSVIKLLTLNVKGSEKQHQIHLEVDGKPISSQLALQGGFDRHNQNWHGKVNKAIFNTPLNTWTLTNVMTLDYLNTQKSISIGQHCWNNINAALCVPKIITGRQYGEAHLILNYFNLEIFNPLLNKDIVLSGMFTGKANINWKVDNYLPTFHISLIGQRIKIVKQAYGTALPIIFNKLVLNAIINNNHAQIDWLIKIKNNGQFNGHIQVVDQQMPRNIKGHLNIKNFSLSMLKPVLMQGEKATGILNGKLYLDGSTLKPRVFGLVTLDKVNIHGPFIPFDIIDSRLLIKFNGMTSKLEGRINTSHGQINLIGDTDWIDLNKYRARIIAQGNKLRVTMSPMIDIDISPDVIFEASPKLLSLYGSLKIPWARIMMQKLPKSIVSISSDEVMLNDKLEFIQPKTTSIPINSNLTIHIGDDVLLDAFGLKVHLQGDLNMAKNKKGIGINGQINISSGRFHAYGQDLIIRKGRLIFSGLPDQPRLNIEAIRDPEFTEDNIIAGVRITGLLDAPKLEVFSDPTKSQQEALSYLLRGQGLYSASTNSNTMTSMLIGIGVAKSNQLVGRIGKAFGVTDLTLDTQGIGNNTKVVVSGHVLPGLQVKYGMGIFDSLSTLTLRYRLMPKLYIEAISSINQTLDLLYKFEF